MGCEAVFCHFIFFALQEWRPDLKRTFVSTAVGTISKNDLWKGLDMIGKLVAHMRCCLERNVEDSDMGTVKGGNCDVRGEQMWEQLCKSGLIVDDKVLMKNLLERAQVRVVWLGEQSTGLTNDVFLGKHFHIYYDVLRCDATCPSST